MHGQKRINYALPVLNGTILKQDAGEKSGRDYDR